MRSQPTWFFVLTLTLTLAAAPAGAVPILDKSKAVRQPRDDMGTGLCGSFTHYTPRLLNGESDATALANLPATDPAVLGRTARLFDKLNFRNGQPSTMGDFTQPDSPDGVFPYSADAMAMPMGSDNNTVGRLRGYFNVPAAKTISFGVNCDDFCSLHIGGTLIVKASEQVSARVIKQVTFKDPGLYPVELLYFQQGSTAYLEWSQADSAVTECPNDICNVPLTSPNYASKFKLVPAAELFSAKVGMNASCQECGIAGTDCAAGNYCSEGLCQVCVVPDHCGPTCVTCPQSAPLCSDGKCVECTADDQCAVGTICDIPNGRCILRPTCTSDADCRPLGFPCNFKTHLCENDEFCRRDENCPAGKSCIQGDCVPTPVPCNADADCKDGFYCELGDHMCKPGPATSGSGCAAGAASGATSPRGISLTLLFGALLVVWLRRRRFAAR